MENIIKNYKYTILNYIYKYNLKDLQKNNYTEYCNHLKNKFPIFYDQYPSVFNMIITYDDLSMLDIMLDNINKLNKSNNVEKDLLNIRNEMGNQLHDKYVKPFINE